MTRINSHPERVFVRFRSSILGPRNSVATVCFALAALSVFRRAGNSHRGTASVQLLRCRTSTVVNCVATSPSGSENKEWIDCAGCLNFLGEDGARCTKLVGVMIRALWWRRGTDGGGLFFAGRLPLQPCAKTMAESTTRVTKSTGHPYIPSQKRSQLPSQRLSWRRASTSRRRRGMDGPRYISALVMAQLTSRRCSWREASI